MFLTKLTRDVFVHWCFCNNNDFIKEASATFVESFAGMRTCTHCNVPSSGTFTPSFSEGQKVYCSVCCTYQLWFTKKRKKTGKCTPNGESSAPQLIVIRMNIVRHSRKSLMTVITIIAYFHDHNPVRLQCENSPKSSVYRRPLSIFSSETAMWKYKIIKK